MRTKKSGGRGNFSLWLLQVKSDKKYHKFKILLLLSNKKFLPLHAYRYATMKVTDNIRHTHTVISSEYIRHTLIRQQSGGYFSMLPFAASENFKKPCGFLSGNLEIRENSVNTHTHTHTHTHRPRASIYCKSFRLQRLSGKFYSSLRPFCGNKSLRSKQNPAVLERMAENRAHLLFYEGGQPRLCRAVRDSLPRFIYSKKLY